MEILGILGRLPGEYPQGVLPLHRPGDEFRAGRRLCFGHLPGEWSLGLLGLCIL